MLAGSLARYLRFVSKCEEADPLWINVCVRHHEPREAATLEDTTSSPANDDHPPFRVYCGVEPSLQDSVVEIGDIRMCRSGSHHLASLVVGHLLPSMSQFIDLTRPLNPQMSIVREKLASHRRRRGEMPLPPTPAELVSQTAELAQLAEEDAKQSNTQCSDKLADNPVQASTPVEASEHTYVDLILIYNLVPRQYASALQQKAMHQYAQTCLAQADKARQTLDGLQHWHYHVAEIIAAYVQWGHVRAGADPKFRVVIVDDNVDPEAVGDASEECPVLRQSYVKQLEGLVKMFPSWRFYLIGGGDDDGKRAILDLRDNLLEASTKPTVEETQRVLNGVVAQPLRAIPSPVPAQTGPDCVASVVECSEAPGSCRQDRKESSGADAPDAGAAGDQGHQKSISLSEADLVLLDLHLIGPSESRRGPGIRDQAVSGKDLLPLFANVLPGTPVFVTTKSQDFTEGRESLGLGADDFIPKSKATMAPALYMRFIRRTGALLLHLRDTALRRQLLANLRYWRFKREFLWFGDKCYHMIGHSYHHASNVWENANSILAPILAHFPTVFADDEDLFVFCMAVWLHDIGHKGNARYGEAFQIRDMHGLISGELVLDAPEDFGVWATNEPERDQESPYSGVTFDGQQTAMELMRQRIARVNDYLNVRHVTHGASEDAPVPDQDSRRRELKRLLRAERIALLCIHHQSNTVLKRQDAADVRNNKRIPLDVLRHGSREEQPYALEDFCSMIGDREPSDGIAQCTLLNLAALLRAVDATDISRLRVGDANERDAKQAGLARDIAYQFRTLQRMVEALADQANLQSGARARFVHLFYELVVDNVRQSQYVAISTRQAQQEFLTSNVPQLRLEIYNSLVDFIEFIAVQDGHFDFHSSVETVEVVHAPDDPRNFDIYYHSNRGAEWLRSRHIRQKGDKDKVTLAERFVGTAGKPGYVRTDFDKQAVLLKHFFCPQVGIFLVPHASSTAWADGTNPEIVLNGVASPRSPFRRDIAPVPAEGSK